MVVNLIKKRIQKAKRKAGFVLKAEEAGLPLYDLYEEQNSKKENLIFLKCVGGIAKKENYNKYLALLGEDEVYKVSSDRIRYSLDPFYFLKQLSFKLETNPSVNKQAAFVFRNICRIPEVVGAYLKIKGKTNSLRTKTKIFNFGRVSYTGNYTKDYQRKATFNHSTKRGVIGLTLKLCYKNKYQEL